MKAVLRLDLPWLVAAAATGSAAVAAAIALDGPPHVFCIGAENLQSVHLAMAGFGLAAGLWMMVVDQVLGVRETIMQRPLTAARLFDARAAGVALAIAASTLVGSLVAWLWWWAFGDLFVHDWPRGIGDVIVVSAVAWSMAAVGMLGGVLPASWVQRVLFMALLGAAVHGGGDAAIELFAEEPDGRIGLWWPHVVWHMVIAAGLLLVARRVAGEVPDADRPWSARVRRLVGPVFIAATALVASWICTEGESQALRELSGRYPDVVLHDGGLALAHRSLAGDACSLVDADHEPIAGAPVRARLFAFGLVEGGPRPVVRGKGPLLHEPRRVFFAGRVGRLILNDAGRVFVRSREGASMRPTGKGPDRVPFQAGAETEMLGKEQVIVEPDSDLVWRFDADAGWFRAESRPLRKDPAPPSVATSDLVPLSVDQLHRLGFVICRHDEVDPPLGSRIEAPAQGDWPAFAHTFAPRTWSERGLAGLAMVMTALRPPLLLAVANATPGQSGPSWLLDPMVRGGRRPWLVLIAFAAMLPFVLSMRRSLQRLGAPPSAVRGWTLLILLFGLLPWLCCLQFERRRHYARPAFEPAEPPRLLTKIAASS